MHVSDISFYKIISKENVSLMDSVHKSHIYFALYCITQTWWGSDGDCYIDLTDVMLPNQKSIKSSSKAMCCVIINALYKLETWFT